MLSNQLVFLNPLYLDDSPDVEPLGIDCAQAGGDFAVFVIPDKLELIRVQALVTENCAGATTTPIVKFDIRPVAGSDAGRGDGDGGTLKLATTTAGHVVYDDAKEGAILYPGQEVVVELAQAASGTGASGHFRPALVCKSVPELPVNMANMTRTD